MKIPSHFLAYDAALKNLNAALDHLEDVESNHYSMRTRESAGALHSARCAADKARRLCFGGPLPR